MKNTATLFASVIISIAGLYCESNQPNTVKPDETDPLVISDIDGNEYHTVRIGRQLWTVEDLRTTKYNDGTPVQLVTGDAAWSTSTSGAYCSYFNTENAEDIRTYGLLYNWYAVNTGKLAPNGWHVPSINDWYTLRDYLIANRYNWDSTSTGNKVAKAIASQNGWKHCDTIGTIGNNNSTNNKSGFSALPSGSRYINGVFGNRGLMSHWWTSTPTFASNIFSIFLTYERDSMVVHGVQKNKGFVVRIVKDN
jgi:uncharacterized protein (TIGR02145 family)